MWIGEARKRSKMAQRKQMEIPSCVCCGSAALACTGESLKGKRNKCVFETCGLYWNMCELGFGGVADACMFWQRPGSIVPPVAASLLLKRQSSAFVPYLKKKINYKR